MKREILVYQKSVYGRTMMYVYDDDLAKSIAALTKKITVDLVDIEALRELGHKVRVIELPGVSK